MGVFFFPTYNLGFFGGFFVFPGVKNWPFSRSQVTKDMIGEASGSDLVLPSEEVEDVSALFW